MKVNPLKGKGILKKSAFLLIMMQSINIAYGQTSAQKKPKGNYNRVLTPARGYYKQLASFSPAPKSSHEEVDKKKFITDQAAIEKRLSLKPIYLNNVSADDFKLPDPP